MATKKKTAAKVAKTPEKEENKFMRVIRKIFGGTEMSWRNVIALAIILGVWTALMAMFVPDGNSFHDIAVTPEWWVLPAIFIIVNCKKPLEAALKTFVFFLISQPLVYLIQVPFNSMGFSLFMYYKYWFIATLFTFPGAYLGWYIKHDKWYSAIILSVMTVLLALIGVAFTHTLLENPPSHLLTIIYCFAIIPVFLFAIFKDKITRIITAVITVIAISIYAPMSMAEMYTAYNNQFIRENDITFVGKPYVSSWSGSIKGNVEIIDTGDGYNFKLEGAKGREYQFSITDGETEEEYNFKYYFDNNLQTVVIERL